MVQNKINKTISLIPHRIFPLKNQDIAVISDESTAWAVLKNTEYEVLKKHLKDLNIAKNKPKKHHSIIDKLFESGLLTIGGHSHSKTNPSNNNIPSSLLLKLTGACNTNCDYCYDYDEVRWKGRLKFSKIKEAVDYILSQRDNLGIAFHGGEPLLRFDLIRQIVSYVKEKMFYRDFKKNIKFSIQTNAILLDEEKITFLKENNFSVGISIDGITEKSNRLRKNKKGETPLRVFKNLVKDNLKFLRDNCGILSVVSKANILELPDFAIWLQEKGINNLGLSFMDAAGKGIFIPEEIVSPEDAVLLFKEFCALIETGKISNLNLSDLTSRISNLFEFQPKDFCYKGPCAASREFLVIDAENKYRTCDSVYHPFFLIGNTIGGQEEEIARKNVVQRYKWLKEDSLTCNKCPILSFCGGTCVAKAIASSFNPFSISHIECAISKYLYPKLLDEFAYSDEKSLINYYLKHSKHK